MPKLRFTLAAMGLASLGLSLAPIAHAQIESVDPDTAYQAEYPEGTGSSWEEGGNGSTNADNPYAGSGATYSGSDNAQTPPDPGQQAAEDWSDPYSPSGDPLNQSYDQNQPYGSTGNGNAYSDPTTQSQAADTSITYQEDDLIGAAEGVFGKGAEGLATLIRDILKDQGQPNAYIVGREGGGAIGVGLRYGSGTLFHKVEGEQPAYWTGPSIGFDAGAQAANTFVLVYNLYDSEELFQRYPAAEGAAYLIGGFHTSYLRSGNVVLIPVRVGVGARLGVNVGYMKFSKKQNWFPF